jgi:uncharacterized protein (DUF427 family)
MPKAIWNGVVIAEASDSEVQMVENNLYFPPSRVNHAYLQASEKHSVCGWKGTASYYDVVVDGKVNENAAWYYPTPMEAAGQITGYIAFWRGVNVSH